MQPDFDAIDHRLHDTVLDLVLDHGPQPIPWLARRARRILRDARVDEDAVTSVISCSTLFAPLPSGEVDHALSVLEGNVLTHRVRAPLAGRDDLWLGCGAQPVLNLATFRAIPLADGSGEVRRAEGGHDVLVGPPGWLPAVERYELIGLRVVDQKLHVEPIGEDDLASPEQQLRARQMIAESYRTECWISGADDWKPQPALLARAITVALMEDPELFRTPYPPLDELLHNPLRKDVDLDHWRDLATTQQVATVGMWLEGIPEALSIELNRRASTYGMAESQFIVALLSTLAWRTPFAEDIEPWDHWDPDRRPAPVADLETKREEF